MKTPLVVLAAAGLLASGAAAADSFSLRVEHRSYHAVAPQDHYVPSPPYYGDRRYRWDAPAYRDQHFRWDPPTYRDDGDRHDPGRRFTINEREERLRERIAYGRSTGMLSPREARRLIRQLRDIEDKERGYYHGDGRLTRWERQDLHRDLDMLAANVRAQARDHDRY